MKLHFRVFNIKQSANQHQFANIVKWMLVSIFDEASGTNRYTL